MTDIATQLRKFAAIQPAGNGPSHLATEAANEIERLRAIVEWLAEWACCDFTDDTRFGPVMTCEDYGDREPLEDYPVPAAIADLLRATHAKHGGRAT